MSRWFFCLVLLAGGTPIFSLCSAARLKTRGGGVRTHANTDQKLSGKQRVTAGAFTLVNNIKLPLNLLVVPKVLRFTASPEVLAPNGKFSMPLIMGAYDIHTLIHDGENEWVRESSVVWSLFKDGTKVLISQGLDYAVGYSVLGPMAGVAVGSTLATGGFGAPVIIAGVALAYAGTAFGCSFAIGFLTEKSANLIKDRIAMLGKAVPKVEHLKSVTKSGSEYYTLADIVQERLILDMLLADESFKHVEVEATKFVIAKEDATRYINAINQRFESSVSARGRNRKIIVTGAFQDPIPLKHTDLYEVKFEDLAFSEPPQKFGCEFKSFADNYWSGKYEECVEHCTSAQSDANRCERICWNLLGRAVGHETAKPASLQESRRKWEQLMGTKPKGKVNLVKLDDEGLQDAVAAMAEIGKLVERKHLAQWEKSIMGAFQGIVSDVDFPSGTAQVAVGRDGKFWFPFEVIAPAQSPETPVFDARDRNRLNLAARFGKCWSLCAASGYRVVNSSRNLLKSAITLGGVGTWCYASNLDPYAVATPCSEDDECANMLTTQGGAAQWQCVKGRCR